MDRRPIFYMRLALYCAASKTPFEEYIYQSIFGMDFILLYSHYSEAQAKSFSHVLLWSIETIANSFTFTKQSSHSNFSKCFKSRPLPQPVQKVQLSTKERFLSDPSKAFQHEFEQRHLHQLPSIKSIPKQELLSDNYSLKMATNAMWNEIMKFLGPKWKSIFHDKVRTISCLRVTHNKAFLFWVLFAQVIFVQILLMQTHHQPKTGLETFDIFQCSAEWCLRFHLHTGSQWTTKPVLDLNQYQGMTAIFQLDWYPDISTWEVLWKKYSCDGWGNGPSLDSIDFKDWMKSLLTSTNSLDMSVAEAGALSFENLLLSPCNATV